MDGNDSNPKELGVPQERPSTQFLDKTPRTVTALRIDDSSRESSVFEPMSLSSIETKLDETASSPGVPNDLPVPKSDRDTSAEGIPAEETPILNSTQNIPIVSSAYSATNTQDSDDRCDIEKQPYEFDHCTVQIAIQLLPDDGDPHGRVVIIGTRSHLDSPILRCLRLNQLGDLPSCVNTLLDQLKSELPTRAQSAHEAYEKKKAAQAKRNAVVNASKTSARGKKTKATLATAPTPNTTPATSAAVVDNRPRPEVQVTVAPQQQMGLF